MPRHLYRRLAPLLPGAALACGARDEGTTAPPTPPTRAVAALPAPPARAVAAPDAPHAEAIATPPAPLPRAVAAPPAPDAASAAGQAAPAAEPGARRGLTLLAGGDVSYGRGVGQIALRDPERDLFAAMKPLFATADLRFANLESQLSDQKGETESPRSQLIFTGPPEGAGALARAGIDLVSLANNHALDYGRRALFETMGHLDRAGVRYVGAGRSRKGAYAPRVVERGGFRLAVLAVTDVWNQGPSADRADADFVARADADGLPAFVRALKKDASIDAVAVSYHGGREFVPEPLARTRALLRAAIDAGADVAIGHHPHVVQGVEWRGGKPILYSLGNFLMQMHSARPWVDVGYLARVRLARGAAPRVEACPFRAPGGLPRPLTGDPLRGTYEREFFARLEQISAPLGGVAIGPTGADGCAPLSEAAGAARAGAARPAAR